MMLAAMRTWLPVALAVAACGPRARDRDPPPGPASKGQPPDAAAVASWPAPPAPAPLAELGLAWPTSYDDAKTKWPTLVGDEGLRLRDLTVRLQADRPPEPARLWVDKAGLDLRVLERAWGQLVRDPSGHAVWFDPKRHVKARYPARHASLEGVELSYYEPVLDRIAAAPDGMLAGAGPLLGQPASALDDYQRWIALRDDIHAQIQLPPGEWDHGSLSVIASIDKGRIHRVQVSVRVGAPPVDEAALRERMRARWGDWKIERDEAKWGRDGTRVTLSKSLGMFQITFERP